MYCPNCGKELDDNNIFCRYCGTKIDDDVQEKNNVQTTAVPRRNNTTLIIIISVVGALLIMAILIAVHMGQKSSSYTVDDNNQKTSSSYSSSSNSSNSYSSNSNSGSKSSTGFSIEGKWKSVGSYGFGQAQPGAIVVFDGTNCNFFSPSDTYAIYKNGGSYTLDVTSILTSKTLSFSVNVIDKDNIELTYGGKTTKLKRMS